MREYELMNQVFEIPAHLKNDPYFIKLDKLLAQCQIKHGCYYCYQSVDGKYTFKHYGCKNIKGENRILFAENYSPDRGRTNTYLVNCPRGDVQCPKFIDDVICKPPYPMKEARYNSLLEKLKKIILIEEEK